jgi:hypothetical protein
MMDLPRAELAATLGDLLMTDAASDCDSGVTPLDVTMPLDRHRAMRASV